MDKYLPLIQSINNGLNKFSTYLSDKYSINPFSEKIENDRNFIDITKVNWDAYQFPNSDCAGVYFLFASLESDSNKLGLYIGKASHKSLIGFRMYSHLYQPLRHQRKYLLKDKSGETYNAELISSIGMKEIYFMAPALEEFLIYHMQDEGHHILNSVGKIK